MITRPVTPPEKGALLLVAKGTSMDPTDTTWMADAACRDADLDVFFDTVRNPDTVKEAMRFCRRCPVRDDCLDYALATDQTNGIWGGTTDRERARQLRNAA